MIKISEGVLDEFADVATIRDKLAFSTRLSIVIEREVKLALRNRQREKTLTEVSIPSFRADHRWEPSALQIQRGRTLMLSEFRKPHNLPVANFALLAGQSRQQIYRDIQMRRLLALSIGTREQRIPDWQLDGPSKKLTQALLEKAQDVDEWTLYYALSEPCEELSRKAPVEVVSAGNMRRTLDALLTKLDIHS